MSVNHDEFIRRLEKLRLDRTSGTLIVTTEDRRIASITLNRGIIVAATYGTTFGLQALQELSSHQPVSSTLNTRLLLKVPIAEIDDAAAAERILRLGMTDDPSPRAPESAARPVIPPSATDKTGLPAAAEKTLPRLPLSGPVLITIEEVANSVLGNPQGTLLFDHALRQLDDEVATEEIMSLLIGLMIDDMDDVRAASEFAARVIEELHKL